MRDAEDDYEYYAYPHTTHVKVKYILQNYLQIFFICNNMILRICGTPMGNSRHTLWEPLRLTIALSLRQQLHPTPPSPYNFHLSVI